MVSVILGRLSSIPSTVFFQFPSVNLPLLHLLRSPPPLLIACRSCLTDSICSATVVSRGRNRSTFIPFLTPNSQDRGWASTGRRSASPPKSSDRALSHLASLSYLSSILQSWLKRSLNLRPQRSIPHSMSQLGLRSARASSYSTNGSSTMVVFVRASIHELGVQAADDMQITLLPLLAGIYSSLPS